MKTAKQELMLEKIQKGYFNRLRNIAQIVRSYGYDDLSTRFKEDELPVQVCYYCEDKLGDNFFVFREKGVVFAMMKECLDYLVAHEDEAINEREERFYDFEMRKQNMHN